MKERGKERVVLHGRRKRLISSYMLLTLGRAAFVNNKWFDVGAMDHRGGLIDGMNPGVDKVIKEFVD